MQMEARALARAEARYDMGVTVGAEATGILANIDAMQLAVDDAAAIQQLTPRHFEEIHAMRLKRALNSPQARGCSPAPDHASAEALHERPASATVAVVERVDGLELGGTKSARSALHWLLNKSATSTGSRATERATSAGGSSSSPWPARGEASHSGTFATMIVRCTKKLLDLQGGRSVTAGEFPATDEDWYLDLLWIDRRKCLLLIHAGTLFPVFRADVRSAELRPPGPYLVAAVQAELSAERLPPDTFGPLQPDNVRIARTVSRSMLGFMNQMTVEIRYQVMRSDDVRTCDINALNHQLRRTLRNRGGYVRPIDLVAAYCAPFSRPTRPADAARVAPPAARVPSRKTGVAREAPNHGPYHYS